MRSIAWSRRRPPCSARSGSPSAPGTATPPPRETPTAGRPVRRGGRAALLALWILALAPAVAAAQQTAPSAPAWELSDLAADPRWVAGTGDSGAGSEGRAAIIAAADETQGREDWRIQFALTNATAIRDVLVRRWGVADDAVQLLHGQLVHGPAIEAAIDHAALTFSGPSNLLVLYFTGHAYVDATGAPVFFTYYTRDAGDGTFDGVISRDRLLEWLVRAKAAARERGAGFRVLVIVDACRVRTLAPSSPAAATITPAAEWEWYGTRAGRFAEAPLGAAPSPFTAALVDASEQLAHAGEITLSQLAAQVGRLTAERTAGRQEPELIRAAAPTVDPVLIGPPAVGIGIEVVDAVSGRPLPDAVVGIGDREVGGVGAVQVVPGRHQVRVAAPGFLRRRVEVDIGPEREGQLLELPIHPSVVLVRGQVVPPRAVSVAARGLSAASDFYRLRTTSDADGRFALRLPESAFGAELDFAEGGRAVRAVTLPGVPTEFVRPPGTSYEGVPVVDVGTVPLSPASAEIGALYRASSAAIDTGLPWPPAVSDAVLRDPPVLSDAVAADRLRAVARYAEAARWPLARRNLLELLGSHTPLEAGARARLEGLLAWVAARERLADTSGAEAGSLAQTARARPLVELAIRAAAIERQEAELRRRLTASPVHADSVRQTVGRLTAALRWTGPVPDAWPPVARAVSAWLARESAGALRRLVEAERWPETLALGDALSAASIPQVDSLLAEVLPTALRGALEGAIAEAMRDGDWRQARSLAGLARSRYPADTALAALAGTAQREDIPAVARRRYQEAERLFADGNLEGAWRAYGLALDSANAAYRALIAPQREYLRQQLFIQCVTRGEAAELAGNDPGALAAYLRASEFDARVDARIAELLSRDVRAPRADVEAWQRRRASRAGEPHVPDAAPAVAAGGLTVPAATARGADAAAGVDSARGARAEIWSGAIPGLPGWGYFSMRITWSDSSFTGVIADAAAAAEAATSGQRRFGSLVWSAELAVGGVVRLAHFVARPDGETLAGEVWVDTRGTYAFTATRAPH
ncbi:MAG TPA: hypothetical protein VMT21_04050 [Gemmatimonadales bacterium]|nr:hypothetical protein [Gemmatimonadales bacterium]